MATVGGADTLCISLGTVVFVSRVCYDGFVSSQVLDCSFFFLYFNISFRLASNHNYYKAELLAINAAISLAPEAPDAITITIRIDSQTSLDAIAA
jgi:hypothetical protein